MQSIVLRDGRRLAYSWLGAPHPAATKAPAGATAAAAATGAAGSSAAAATAGNSQDGFPSSAPPKVVLHFHGFLSSRLEAGLMQEDAQRLGLAVLAVDRPGAGGSSFNADRTLESTAEDARELLDALGLQTVVVQGASGGAPFACATAALLGERAEALLLTCPLFPAAGREEELLAGCSASTLRLFHGARHSPWRLWATLHTLRLLQRIPHGSLLVRLGGFAPEDRACMEQRPELAKRLQAAVREGLAQGVGAAMQDLQLFYVHPHAADLSAIRCPTQIWQGELDATTPPAMARAYAQALPSAQLHVLAGEGHLSLPFRHNGSILGSVAGPASQQAADS